MRLPLVIIAAVLGAAGTAAAAAKLPPLRDPIFLNIGFVCQWQERWIQSQQRAHRRAIAYVKKSRPPSWKVQLCNRRATLRRTGRVDWISYNHCIRNPKVRRGSASR